MHSRITKDLPQLWQIDLVPEGLGLTHARMAEHNPHNCLVVVNVDADDFAGTFDAEGHNRISARNKQQLVRMKRRLWRNTIVMMKSTYS